MALIRSTTLRYEHGTFVREETVYQEPSKKEKNRGINLRNLFIERRSIKGSMEILNLSNLMKCVS